MKHYALLDPSYSDHEWFAHKQAEDQALAKFGWSLVGLLADSVLFGIGLIVWPGLILLASLIGVGVIWYGISQFFNAIEASNRRDARLYEMHDLGLALGDLRRNCYEEH